MGGEGFTNWTESRRSHISAEASSRFRFGQGHHPVTWYTVCGVILRRLRKLVETTEG